ncbi:MAG: polysaccharide biosynthesis tyrosine autokinase, partial [Actinomycetota bacterium]|nr:polysaccharide biosynthesis tyrosine autokinase [Actinomycetota bacterium]
VRRWRARGPAVSLADPSSPAAEAYRTLRTSIKFLRLDTAVRLMQVTSPSAAEGKTSTVANLGVALAMAGQRVIVVCCDLRRPRLHESFGLDNTVGLTTVVVGEVALSDALQPVPGATGLRLLASGPLPPNPAELLSSRRGGDVLSALRDDADIVILDCPPLLPVTDAVVVSALVDATVVVTTANLTKRKELTRAIELLRQADAPLVGTVFNGVKAKGGSRYRYEHYGQRRRRLSKKRTRPALAAADPALDGDATSTPEVSQPPADAPSSSASSSGASSAAAAQRTVDASGDGQPAHVTPGPSDLAPTTVEEAGAGPAGGTVEGMDGEDWPTTAQHFPDWFKDLFRAAARAPTDSGPSRLMVAGRPGMASELRETDGFEIESLVLMPGATTETRVHQSSDVMLYRRKGALSIRFGQPFERWETLELGNLCLIPASTPYTLANPSDSDWLEVTLAQRVEPALPTPGTASRPAWHGAAVRPPRTLLEHPLVRGAKSATHAIHATWRGR